MGAYITNWPLLDFKRVGNLFTGNAFRNWIRTMHYIRVYTLITSEFILHSY